MEGLGKAVVRAVGMRMSFGSVEVLRGVDLELRSGEIHAIVGENGAGKSTLAKLIGGVYRPTGGQIEVTGRAVSFAGPKEAIDAGIGLIHQEPLTFPDLDVAQNMFVGREPLSTSRFVDWKELRARADEILGQLGVGLKSRDKVRGLSIAQQQMVEMATAMSQRARALIMDETTAALTPNETAELFAVARRLRDSGCALAFVSHRLEEVFELCDRITVLRDGGLVVSSLTTETTIDDVVRAMVGRDLNPGPHTVPSTRHGSAALEVDGLSRGRQFRDVSFRVIAGEILGLGGLVGSGRTSIAKSIFGIERPESGTIKVAGRRIELKDPAAAMRAGIALVPEDRRHHGLMMPMSVTDNMALATLKDLSRNGWTRRGEERRVAQNFVSQLRIALRDVGQVVGELSGGNQQKVVLAKWLQTKPQVLILDEPTRGIDVGAKEEVYRLMRELADGGMAILMISSDLPELLAMSDRIVVARSGRIVAEFGSRPTEEEVMRAATGQEARAS